MPFPYGENVDTMGVRKAVEASREIIFKYHRWWMGRPRSKTYDRLQEYDRFLCDLLHCTSTKGEMVFKLAMSFRPSNRVHRNKKYFTTLIRINTRFPREEVEKDRKLLRGYYGLIIDQMLAIQKSLEEPDDALENCRLCKKDFPPDDVSYCMVCGDYACPECVRICRACGDIMCKECDEANMDSCVECETALCNNHYDSMCDACEFMVCPDCMDMHTSEPCIV